MKSLPTTDDLRARAPNNNGDDITAWTTLYSFVSVGIDWTGLLALYGASIPN